MRTVASVTASASAFRAASCSSARTRSSVSLIRAAETWTVASCCSLSCRICASVPDFSSSRCCLYLSVADATATATASATSALRSCAKRTAASSMAWHRAADTASSMAAACAACRWVVFRPDCSWSARTALANMCAAVSADAGLVHESAASPASMLTDAAGSSRRRTAGGGAERGGRVDFVRYYCWPHAAAARSSPLLFASSLYSDRWGRPSYSYATYAHIHTLAQL
eukprot:scaffold13857_cov107-Isochrysis_galbana.AAC.4